MKDFGNVKLGGKEVHITAEDEVPNEDVVFSMIGMKLAELFDIDIKIVENK